jgi:hypothetical protein
MAVTNAQIVEFLLANPGMSDADIAAVMRTYGVDPSQVAEATGSDVAAIQERFDAVAAPEPVDEPLVTPRYEEPAAPVAPATPVAAVASTPVTPVADVAPVAPKADVATVAPAATPVAGSVTTAQIVDFLTTNPDLSDAAIVKVMETYKVSPAELAKAVGLPEGTIAARIAETVPNGQTITLGDTVVQPVYKVTGSGEDQQVGGIENVITYKASENKKDGAYTQYLPSGEVEKTGTQQEVKSGLKEFAIGTALLLGLPTILNAGAAAGGAATAVGAEAATAFELANAGIAGGTAGFTPAQLALIEAGATAAEVTAAGGGLLTSATPVAAGSTATAGAAAGGAAGGGGGLLTPTAAAPTGATLKAGASSLLPTNALTGATLGTTLLPAAVAPVATSLLPAAVTATGTGLLTKAAESVIGKAVTGGLTTAGGLVQAQVSKEAAQAAQKKIDDETAAAKTAAQFRPVGMTTRFGSSQFAFDPKTGQLTSAGYTLSPEAKAAQDRFVKLAESGITQAEGAQKAFEPLQTGAQSLFTLGNKYLAQTPEQVAQDYLKSQMALLQPGRELELANLQNKLQQQGRGGLSVAQGGSLGATTPELQALFNARAQQEAILAANAQREGQQNVLFGAGLLGTGASTMGQYYGGQQAAYSPYTSAINQVQALETAGQQPFTMGVNLGQIGANAGANVGKLGLTGAGQSVALATGAAATNSPLATALTGLGSSGLLTTGIDMVGKAIGNRLDDPLNELVSSFVAPTNEIRPTGPMNVNTADMARGLGIKLPTNYTGTTTTVNPLAPTQQYTF